MYKDSKIYVAGHRGLLGSALCKILKERGYQNIITRSRDSLDLTDQRAVDEFFKGETPEYVFLCAGLTGGIYANRTYPADFLHVNISMQDNVFQSANKYGVKHLVFYGSSCIYPKICPQPMKEEYMLTGAIEETSEAYAIAKMSGIIACRAYNRQYKTNRFIALVPNSMYGPNDDFSEENSHVLSALIRKINDAKESGKEEVILWGSGNPRREFIYSEDVAEASIFAIENVEGLENMHYNIGTGVDYSIKDLADTIAEIIGYKGRITWDTSKPDGAPRKLLDSSRFLALGWKPRISFKEGLKATIKWYLENIRAITV